MQVSSVKHQDNSHILTGKLLGNGSRVRHCGGRRKKSGSKNDSKTSTESSGPELRAERRKRRASAAGGATLGITDLAKDAPGGLSRSIEPNGFSDIVHEDAKRGGSSNDDLVRSVAMSS